MTSRELVKSTLEMRNFDNRAPRNLWYLEWSKIYHPEALERIQRNYPNDCCGVATRYTQHSQVERGKSVRTGNICGFLGLYLYQRAARRDR